jgi:hypothetical protein
MAVSNIFNSSLMYDPYSDRQMLKEQYLQELQSLKQMNAQQMNRQQMNAQLVNGYLSNPGSLQQAATAPIPQPEPYMNPVLLLLE